MRRRIYTTLAAASVLLCATTVALWVRSYFVGDAVGHRWVSSSPSQVRSVVAAGHDYRGWIEIDLERVDAWLDTSPLPPVSSSRTGWRVHRLAELDRQGARNDFDHIRDDLYLERDAFNQNGGVWSSTPARDLSYPTGWTWEWNSGGAGWLKSWRLTARVPNWCPVALFAAAALLFAWLRTRARRFAESCCRGCGYDLTGNMSGICPECGRSISAGFRARADRVSARRIPARRYHTPLPRKLLRTGAALSVLMGIAATVLCARSYRAAIEVPVPRVPGWRIVLDRGRVWADNEPLWHDVEDLFFRQLRAFDDLQFTQLRGLAEGRLRVEAGVRRGRFPPEYLTAYFEAADANEQHLRRVYTALRNGQPMASSVTSYRPPKLWKIAAFAAVLPAAWLVSLLARRRNLPGRCFTCGYDLTANTSGVCPECGGTILHEAEAIG